MYNIKILYLPVRYDQIIREKIFEEQKNGTSRSVTGNVTSLRLSKPVTAPVCPLYIATRNSSFLLPLRCCHLHSPVPYKRSLPICPKACFPIGRIILRSRENRNTIVKI